MKDVDTEVRLKAFKFLEMQRARYGDQIPRKLLEQGFEFEDKRVPLLGPQGIFKPQILPDIPISFTTIPIVEGKSRPYDDEFDSSGLIRYRYRGTDPEHRDNVGLRIAMKRRIPMIYFYGVEPGYYSAIWPAYIVGDDPVALSFTVELEDEIRHMQYELSEMELAKRAYLTSVTQRRLHQQSFRIRVMHAYKHACSICRLKHVPLLDAAHILPDNHPKGEPWVSNGLSLCKLHHAAFDANILGIRPDRVIEIREDILREVDGPMLQYGLKECHNQHLAILPSSRRDQPRPEFLEERYELFRAAG
jgi:putative restriction endonuclease